MFPFWSDARARGTDAIARTAGTWRFRIVVAVLFACFHLVMFSCAGRERLGIPFNNAPSSAPYYSDPDAPATLGYPRQPHFWSRLVVSRWDAQHYIGFALRGMTACPESRPANEIEAQYRYLECGLGWFPAYGEIAALVAAPFGWPADVVLVVMSVLATIAINLLWTSDTIARRIGRFESYATMVAFNVFPSAFHLVTPYTESATIALALGGLVCIARDRWVTAGVLVGAATGLRAGALSFVPALGVVGLLAAWKRYRAGDPSWWRPFVAAALSPWGFVVQLVVFQIAVGDWRAYFTARELFGDTREWGRLINTEWYVTGLGAQHMDGLMLYVSFALVALGARELARRLAHDELVFVVVASVGGFVLACVGHTQQYWGLNRYMLTWPLVFLCAGIVARRYPLFFALYLVLCVALYWHVELCSYVTQGRPDVCPCMGRMEFMAPFGS